MDEIVTTLRRRWVMSIVVLVAAVVAAGAMVVRTGPTYSYTSTILLLPPEVKTVPDSGTPDYTHGNPLFYLGSLNQTRDILIGALMSKTTRDAVHNRFSDAGYTASSDVLASSPVVVLTAESKTKREARDAIRYLDGIVPETLAKLQTGLGIGESAQITSYPLQQDKSPEVSHKDEIRAGIVAFGAVGLLGFFLIALIDNLRGGGRAGGTRRPLDSGDDSDSEVGEEEGRPTTGRTHGSSSPGDPDPGADDGKVSLIEAPAAVPSSATTAVEERSAVGRSHAVSDRARAARRSSREFRLRRPESLLPSPEQPGNRTST